MSLRRIGVLLRKELIWGPKSFLFIMALVVPVVLTLVIQLLVGSFFSGKPALGVADEGQSGFVALVAEIDGLVLRQYESAAALQTAVRGGAVDMGLILPAGFDEQIKGETAVPLTVYVYGESLLRDRAFLGVTLAQQFRELAGQESPVTISSETVGDGASVPWEERLLPFLVLMTIMIGGMMVPATSLVEEKQKRTITAVTTAATTLEELFIAKGIVGFGLSLFMGAFILFLNRAFGTAPLLLVALLALGALMAATFGVLLGAFVKDINTLFATIKGIGILLYAPAFVYIFPTIPQWIGRIFPTYYIIGPIVAVTQEGAGWADIRLDVAILVLLNLALIGGVAYIARRARAHPAMLPGVVG
jgi:ABC-2 type transport system permease protein